MSRGRVGLLVVGVVAALVVAGAGGARIARPPASSPASLTTRAAVDRYLLSLGLDPRGFVVQRGARNYAGASCPGKRWTCTTAQRVVQIATAAAASNTFACTTAASPGTSCVVVQSGAKGQNVAVCTQDETAAGSPDSRTESCSITQTSDSGKNTATVTQRILQGGGCASETGQVQLGKQSATVLQQNRAGPNNATVVQDVAQCATTPGTGAAQQSQATDQFFQIEQGGAGFDPGNPSTCPNMTGSNSASATQSQHQSGSAAAATSGTQSQRADLTGHVDQCSNSDSVYSATQTEDQKLAPNAAVAQTQIGPTRFGAGGRAKAAGKGFRSIQKSICCSFQGKNPSDKCTITQATRQTAQQTALQIEDLTTQGQTTGSCSASISSTQVDAVTGQVETNTASSSNPQDAGARLLCTNTVCGSTPIATKLTGLATGGTYSDAATLTATLTTDTAVPVPLAGQTVQLAAGTDSCAAKTDASGVASCTVAIDLLPTASGGSWTASASFASPGGIYASSAASGPFAVAKESTVLSYTGATGGQYGDGATLAATLADDEGGPVSDPSGGPTVGFSLGSLSCSATAAPTTASCAVTLSLSAGSYPVSASYAGDAYYAAAAPTAGTFTVVPEVATLTFTTPPPAYVPAGGTISLAASATDDDQPTGNPVPSGTPIVFTVGGASCAGTVGAVATCAVPSSASGPVPVSVTFASGGNYVTGAPTAVNPAPTAYAPLRVGGYAFVLGDGTDLTRPVTFWGSQWGSLNPTSGGSTPSSFKGFAQTLSIATCKPSASSSTDYAWTTSPAASPPNPSALPAGSVVAMVVASKVSSGPSSSLVSLTIPKVVLVRITSYSSSPGGSGTGAVVGSPLCP